MSSVSGLGSLAGLLWQPITARMAAMFTFGRLLANGVAHIGERALLYAQSSLGRSNVGPAAFAR